MFVGLPVEQVIETFIEEVQAFNGCSGWSVKGSQVELLGLGELDGAPDTLVVLTQCSLLNGEAAILDGTENATSVLGSVLPVHLCVMTREEAISGECVVNFGFAA